MKINQLFRSNVPNDLFKKICDCFGYENLNIEYMFSKIDLDRLSTIAKINELKDELTQYYIPCKAKMYLTNMNQLKCITVFRQILRLNHISLISRQRYIKNKKMTFYSIKFDYQQNEEEKINGLRVNNAHLVINFS